MKFWKENNEHVYWNPYFGGFMLGLLLIATFYITGRGVGATGATKSAVITTVESFAPTYAEGSKFYSKYYDEDKNPMNNWLVFETIGILAGALLSGALSGRVKFRVFFKWFFSFFILIPCFKSHIFKFCINYS